MKIINFKKKRMKSLTNEQQKFEGKHTADIKYVKVRDHCHFT